MGYSFSVKIDSTPVRKIVRKHLTELFEQNNFEVRFCSSDTSYGPRRAMGIDYSGLFGENRLAMETLFARLRLYGKTYYDDEKTVFRNFDEDPEFWSSYYKAELKVCPEAYVNVKAKLELVKKCILAIDAELKTANLIPL